MAGYDPSNAIPRVTLLPRAAVRAAGDTCLAFVTYAVNADTGVAYSTQVTYDVGTSTGTTALRRREDPWQETCRWFASAATGSTSCPSPPPSGSPLPLAMSLQALAFRYFDAYNELLAPAAITTDKLCPPATGAALQRVTLLTLDQLRRVARVSITLRTRGQRPQLQPELFTLTADVRLRNR
jgi:hypothetical protein